VREKQPWLHSVFESRNFSRKIADMLKGRQIVQGDEIEEFWALKNVSFQVEEGEVLGIIGRNGAGKSTLLKVLSQITEPTQGRDLLKGRVASLLEVGTGFHPELTGRENIFVNGAILGMRRSDIKGKFDEIVAFAGVERFHDVRVKRYSSACMCASPSRLSISITATEQWRVLSAHFLGGTAGWKSLRNLRWNMSVRSGVQGQASALWVAARRLRISRGMCLDCC
jgi:ABC-type polysaccharide/polyol phosphate transport system ATPase subunit